MVFSSLEFLFMFFAVSILAYFLVPAKHLKWRNLVLLVVSLIFYGWGEPIYVFLMIFTITIDYIGGWLVDKYRENKKRAKLFVILSVAINLGILGFFKYYDFFATNLMLIPGINGLPLLKDFMPEGMSGLPIGISFYTFQALSYVIDVYRRDGEVQKNVVSFGAFITLFPQLIAGPIIRYKDVDDMLRKRDESVYLFASGVRTFLAGFGKKIFFANIAGQVWESFRDAGSVSVAGAWFGMICYAFQIYFDFSGYSDMAIGLGKMFGFKFLENFNYPYVSKSITEFWRRWHMSLGTWFRDYVYIPLGGNRCSPFRNYLNIFVVWFLTGFWHGASWNYIFWGLYYFVLLVIEKAFLLKFLNKIPKVISHVYTLFFVLFGWLLFVFEDLNKGMIYFKKMFGFGADGFANHADIYEILRNLPLFIILIIAATPLPKKLFYRLYEKLQTAQIAALVGVACVLILGTAYLVDSSYNPFLYFRF